MQPEMPPKEKAKKRNGFQISIIILALIFSCFVSFIFLFDSNSVSLLKSSADLQFNGTVTTGTVSGAEEFLRGNPSFPSRVYKLTVTFEADGKAYRTTGNAFYPARKTSWEGESMQVIYDPENPNAAMIDTFNERWMIPIAELLPE